MKYLAIFAGTAILAFGMFNIHARSCISEGGVLGLSLLIYHCSGISPALSSLVLDTTAFLIGAVVLKKTFLFDSLLASASYALWYSLNEHIGPVLPDFTARPLAAAVLGALFVGIGCGLVVRHGCAAGGDDSLALVFHKLTGLRVSLFYNLSDFAVLLASLCYIPLRRIVWSLLSVLLSSAIIELLRPREKPAE